ncbi:MAG: ABC transporter substrate-binding protein [bacterium]|nr:ABC transporter substrate-binding protein [bacterium]
MDSDNLPRPPAGRQRWWDKTAAAIHSYSVKQQLILAGLAIIFVASLLGLLSYLNNQILTPMPGRGGTLTEGIIGTPRFINPLLAISDADRDLTTLVYSGLIRVNEQGELIPDLAESYTVSADNRIYTFKLKPNLTFHDGQPLTAADVEFTILKAQDPLIKSSRRGAWDGVTVEKIGPLEISFHLKQPYASFLDNATMGILPQHLWQSITPEGFALAHENVEPIGSGPFKISATKFDRSGLPEWYELKSFSGFALGEPHLTGTTIRFYPNEEELLAAYRSGTIQSLSAIRPELVKGLTNFRHQIITAPFPRVFAVFFNQNENEVFTLSEVRAALDLAVDKTSLIDKVLAGYGEPLNGPLPPGALGATADSKNKPASADLAGATSLLEKNGWVKNSDGHWTKKTKGKTYTLSFTLSAPSTPELLAAVQEVVKNWQAFGAEVELKTFELGDLNQNVIRPRKYQALFFGEVVGRDPDPLAFWHSGQRLDPGLNVAMYANISVDKLLTDIRITENREERSKKLTTFDEAIRTEHPAVFLYAPLFVYLLPSQIAGVKLPALVTSADRFTTIYKWYTKVDNVWPFFK